MTCTLAAAGWISAVGSRREPRGPSPIQTLGGGPVRFARGIARELSGAARIRALVGAALADLGEVEASTPLIVASCNGGGDAADSAEWARAFDTRRLLPAPWGDRELPVISGSCVSALHALDTAQALLEAGAEQVLLLAVDGVSAGNQGNFSGLRILDPEPRPYQPANPGFVSGEAAVALLLRPDGDGLSLGRPGLSQDLPGHDGLASCLGAAAVDRVGVAVGQGTGPEEADRVELQSFAGIGLDVPLTTPALECGHALGASSALSLARLACGELPTLPWPAASDGRPLVQAPAPPPGGVVGGRALGGSCAAVGTGSAAGEPPAPLDWRAPAPEPSLFHPGLQRLVAEAPAQRPAAPPDRVVLWLDTPCAPPPRARVGGRVLPSAVLELTPATAGRLLAQAWGYPGPTSTWVGGAEGEVEGLLSAHRARGERLACVRVRDANGEFRVTWGS